MDKRIELLKSCEKGLFIVKKNYLRSPGENGYLLYRILRPILKVRYATFRKLRYPCPWLSPSSVRFLEKYLTREMNGFEYGSGISTLFTAPRVGSLVSVEHNKEWYGLVQDKLKAAGIDNVDYRFISKENPKDNAGLTFDLESKYGFEFRRDYVNYFEAVQSVPDKSLDFILIDGRARTECLFYALPKMKDNAVIILDNSERKRYSIVFDVLKEYETYTTTNGLTDTTFWFKND